MVITLKRCRLLFISLRRCRRCSPAGHEGGKRKLLSSVVACFRSHGAESRCCRRTEPSSARHRRSFTLSPFGRLSSCLSPPAPSSTFSSPCPPPLRQHQRLLSLWITPTTPTSSSPRPPPPHLNFPHSSLRRSLRCTTSVLLDPGSWLRSMSLRSPSRRRKASGGGRR